MIDEWLHKKVKVARVEKQLKKQYVDHPGWVRLKAMIQPKDEIWTFRSPPRTWGAKLGAKLGAAGYALVRDGKVIESLKIMRS